SHPPVRASTNWSFHKKGSSVMLRLLKAPHNEGAKDGECRMSLVEPGGLVSVERVAGGGLARPQSLAIAGAVVGHAAGKRPSDGHDVVAGCRSQRRLPRLLLLPYQPGTQRQNCCYATGRPGGARTAPSR